LWELSQDTVPLYEAGYFEMGIAPIILEAVKKLLA
jgi:hypothetical protein